jgi:hypothetical protein
MNEEQPTGLLFVTSNPINLIRSLVEGVLVRAVLGSAQVRLPAPVSFQCSCQRLLVF